MGDLDILLSRRPHRFGEQPRLVAAQDDEVAPLQLLEYTLDVVWIADLSVGSLRSAVTKRAPIGSDQALVIL
jgi:hypothetical protein